MSDQELPNGWAVVSLRECGDWVGGGTPSKSRPEFWEGGDIPWLSPKDMGPQRLTDTEDHITRVAIQQSSTKVVEGPSVALVVRSGILERVLPVAVVPFTTTMNQDMKAVRPTEAFIPEWIAYGLKALEREILGSCRKAGTTVASIEVPRLMALEFPVPPIAEQRRIVEELERRLSHFYVAVANLSSAAKRIEKARRSVLINALGSTRPEHWKSVTVEDAGDARLGLQRSPSRHSGSNMKPYLKVANVFDDRISLDEVMEMHFTDDEMSRYRLVDGDILLNEGQSPEFLGRPAIWRSQVAEMYFTNSLIRFRCNEDVLPEWALLVFRSHMYSGRFRRESRITTNIAHLALNRFKSVEFPIPPVEEQAKIVAEVRRQLSLLEAASESVQKSLKRAGILWQSLLAAAFTGELVEQDPADEPAGVLLARIQETRAKQQPAAGSTRRPRTPKTKEDSLA